MIDLLELKPPDIPTRIARECAVQLARDLLERMPADAEHQAVRLYLVGGRVTLQELSERFGEAPQTISRWLERFRDRLKRELLLRLVDPSNQLSERDREELAASLGSAPHPVLDPASDDGLSGLSEAPEPEPARAAAIFERSEQTVTAPGDRARRTPSPKPARSRRRR